VDLIELFLVIIGTGLQVWGIRMAARALILASDAAGGRLEAPRLLRWFVGVPRHPQVVNLEAALVGGSDARLAPTVSRMKPPKGDHAAWIEFLDRRVNELERDISSLAVNVRDLHDEQLAQLRALEAEAAELRRKLFDGLRRATVDNARISLAGVLYIVVGIVVTASAGWVARLAVWLLA
jgi:hypothetical protein